MSIDTNTAITNAVRQSPISIGGGNHIFTSTGSKVTDSVCAILYDLAETMVDYVLSGRRMPFQYLLSSPNLKISAELGWDNVTGELTSALKELKRIGLIQDFFLDHLESSKFCVIWNTFIDLDGIRKVLDERYGICDFNVEGLLTIYGNSWASFFTDEKNDKDQRLPHLCSAFLCGLGVFIPMELRIHHSVKPRSAMTNPVALSDDFMQVVPTVDIWEYIFPKLKGNNQVMSQA